MARPINILRQYASRIGLTCMSLFGGQTLYASDFEDVFFSNEYAHFETELMPTRQMSNEQLFRAVEAQRDNSMSQLNKRINHNWLINYRKDNYSGSAAMRNLVKLTIRSFKPLFLKKRHANQTEFHDTKSAFTNIENYRLTASSDALTLGFHYSF